MKRGRSTLLLLINRSFPDSGIEIPVHVLSAGLRWHVRLFYNETLRKAAEFWFRLVRVRRHDEETGNDFV